MACRLSISAKEHIRVLQPLWTTHYEVSIGASQRLCRCLTGALYWLVRVPAQKAFHTSPKLHTIPLKLLADRKHIAHFTIHRSAVTRAVP